MKEMQFHEISKCLRSHVDGSSCALEIGDEVEQLIYAVKEILHALRTIYDLRPAEGQTVGEALQELARLNPRFLSDAWAPMHEYSKVLLNFAPEEIEHEVTP